MFLYGGAWSSSTVVVRGSVWSGEFLCVVCRIVCELLTCLVVMVIGVCAVWNDGCGSVWSGACNVFV